MKGKQKSLAITVLMNLIIAFVIVILMKQIVITLYPSGRNMSSMFNLITIAIAIGGIICLFWWVREKQGEEYKIRHLIYNLSLNIKEETPQLLSKEEEGFGVVYKFSLPCGMTVNEFEKHKLAFEEHLGKEVTFSNGFLDYPIGPKVNITVMKKI